MAANRTTSYKPFMFHDKDKKHDNVIDSQAHRFSIPKHGRNEVKHVIVADFGYDCALAVLAVEQDGSTDR